jgi:hypothetical protein
MLQQQNRLVRAVSQLREEHTGADWTFHDTVAVGGK